MPSRRSSPLSTGRSRRRRVPRSGWIASLACLAVVAVGCDDATVDPLGGLVAGETDAAALALGLPLPTPDQEAIGGDDGPGGTALMDWRASWNAPPAEGRRLREPLYPGLARALHDGMDREDVLDEMARLAEGVRAAQALPHENLPPAVADGIQRAAGSSAAAADAFRRVEHRRALEYVLRGADALREVGPEAVARTVVTEAEELLRRISDDDAYSEKDRTRISRLVRGSRRALDEGDWALAIRRAYYAQGLVDER